ncbi:hypothetical protein D3C71_1878580 [compost metagenome]
MVDPGAISRFAAPHERSLSVMVRFVVRPGFQQSDQQPQAQTPWAMTCSAKRLFLWLIVGLLISTQLSINP